MNFSLTESLMSYLQVVCKKLNPKTKQISILIVRTTTLTENMLAPTGMDAYGL
jgi:hypothetical protein